MLKKYQTDSHVIYGTLRLEIFIKYPLITRESRLFAEIREKINGVENLETFLAPNLNIIIYTQEITAYIKYKELHI